MLAGCDSSAGTECTTSFCKIYIHINSNLQLLLESKMSMRDRREKMAPEGIPGSLPRFLIGVFYASDRYF